MLRKFIFLAIALLIPAIAMGALVSSAPVFLTINGAPLAESNKAEAFSGEQITFTIQPTGLAPVGGYLYQWQKNGVSISGATSNPWTTTVLVTSTGTYTGLVTNKSGIISSNSLALLVHQSLTITKQPSGQTVNINGNAIFTVEAVGTNPLSYQWYKEGDSLTGKTSSLLQVASAQITDAGNYNCQVASSYPGESPVMSNTAVLTVREDTTPPTLVLVYNTSNPTNLSCSQNSHGVPLPNLAPVTQSWAEANINQMGVRFIRTGPINNFLQGNVSPSPMTELNDYSFNLTDPILSGFNGKIAPYFMVSGSRKSLIRNIEIVKLIKNGVETTLTRSDGDYYDLDLR